MSTRLNDRVTEPDWLVQALVVVAIGLYLVGTGWLIWAEIGDAGANHVPTVRIDNQTRLTLEVEVIDDHGGRLTLGAQPPGRSSRLEVADMGPSWTFETFYGHRQVDRQTIDHTTLARQGWTVRIPATATTDLERAGYQ